jgi:hypothetical protein
MIDATINGLHWISGAGVSPLRLSPLIILVFTNIHLRLNLSFFFF